MALLDNIVAYWKFEGNSNDSVGTNNGTDTLVSYGNSYGKINSGFATQLLGGNTRISIPDAAIFKPLKNFSINLWINPSSFINNFAGIIDKYIGGTSGYSIDIPDKTNPLARFQIHTTADKQVKTTSVLSIGVWSMITATYDGVNLKIYFNGALEGTLAETGNVVANTQDLFLTADGVSTLNSINYTDEIGFWNQSLTQTDIIQLYNGGAGLTYPFSTNFLTMF